MCDWGSQVEELYVVLWEEYEEWENKTLKGSYHYIFIVWHNVVFTFHSTSSSLCCVCLSRIKLPNNKRETHLLLLLAFGLLLGWVWYRDVQWSLQGCQVIAAERRLTGNTMLLRPTFSSTDALFFIFPQLCCCQGKEQEVSRRWKTPAQPPLIIPSTASVALQSSEGRILKPALLPVIKKIIIIM